jgi:hypothetical protein
MVKAIPLTHLSDYVVEAKAIQRSVGQRTGADADVRRAVADLAGLAVKALEDTDQAIEGLASLLMALHPEVTRKSRAGRRSGAATGR